jgi:hypothetical protein
MVMSLDLSRGVTGGGVLLRREDRTREDADCVSDALLLRFIIEISASPATASTL